MNVASVRLQRYGQTGGITRKKTSVKLWRDKGAAKVIETAAKGCKGCKEQKRAAAQRCKCAQKEHTHEYTYLYTLKQCTHKYRLYIYAQYTYIIV